MTKPRRAILLLAAVSLSAGLDLSTFRTSYARTTSSFCGLQSYWQNLRSGSEGQAYRNLDLVLHPDVGWASIMRSDAADFEFSAGTDPKLRLQQEVLQDPLYRASQTFDLDWETETRISWRSYVPQSDAFVQMSGVLEGHFLHSTQDDASDRRLRTTTWQALPGGGIALGYGRMRDAWPLARAVRIADILNEEGVLDHRLSDEELRALAGFISRSWKLFYAHDRAARYYYDSLSALLTQTRAINRPLPAYSLFRLDEWQLDDSYRPFGWRAYAELSGSGNGALTVRSSYGNTGRSSVLKGSGRSRVALEYARLLGLRTTFTAGLEYTLPWPITLAGWYRHIGAVHVQGSYIVADRLSADLSALYTPTYAIPYEAGLERQFEHRGQVNLEMRYYLADRLWVAASGSWSASGGADYVEGSWVRRVPGKTLSIGAEVRWGPDSH